MKKNLLAIFLAVTLVAALVFFVAPSAKAADATVVQATETGLPEGFDFDANILDLNGNNVVVTVPVDKTLRVIDTANNTKDGTTNAGTLKNDGAGSIANVAQDPSDKMRYVAIQEGDTYSFQRFNLTFSQVGINTISGETKNQVAVCLRGTYFGNNKALGVITDYGICPIVDGKPGDPISAKENYSFNGNNLMHAYFDLSGSLNSTPDDSGVANIDKTINYCTYMVVNGEPVYGSYAVNTTPREVLKTINESDATPTAAQLERIQALMRTNTRANNILSRFRTEQTEATLDFSTTDNRVSQTTEQQVWSQNGVTLTNDKGASTTNVANYFNPVRLYANSKVTVATPGMIKIVFSCNSASYATDLNNSIGTVSGATVEVSGSTVTVSFASAVDSFVVDKLTAQVQLKSLTVTSGSPDCTHEVNSAKCEVAGKCLDCNKDVSAPGHTLGTPATCKDPAKCDVCGENIDDKLDENAHDYVDGICTICGGNEPQAPVGPTTVTVSIADYAAAKGWSNSVQYNTLEMDKNITVTATGGGNTGKYYTNGYDWRIYQSESPSVTVTATNGMTISTVKITYSVDKTGILTLNGTNVSSETVVTVNANSVTFSVGNTGTATNGQVRITAIEVVYKAAVACTEHTGGQATCTDLAKCEKCGEPYGELAEHSYPADSHDCIYGCNEKSECVDAGSDNACDICGASMGGTTAPELTEKTYSYTFTSKVFSANGSQTLNNISWALAGDGGYWGYDGTKGQQLGSGSKPFKDLTLTSTALSNVSKIVINTSGASDVNASFTVWVGGVQVGESTKLTTSATPYTFEVPEGTVLTGAVEFRYTQTSSKALYIKSISITYAE